MKRLELGGTVFGRLTVLQFFGISPSKHRLWECLCICGSKTYTSTGDLMSGKTVSCGCKRRDDTVDRNTSHGESNSLAYVSWSSMKNRCYNPKYHQFDDYGGRGIMVSRRWKNSFENFLADMGERPSTKYSLERLDVNGDYCAKNCAWIKSTKQARNRRSNRVISTEFGNFCLMEISEKFGIPYGTLKGRLRKGVDSINLLRKTLRK